MTNTPKNNYNRYKKYSTDLTRYYKMPAVQTSLTVVLSIFITAFFVLVALRPTFVTIAKLKKTITEQEDTLKKLQTKAASLQKIANEKDKFQPLEKYVDNNIPQDGPRYDSITKSLEILAMESNVALSSMTIGDALTYSSVTNPYTGNNRKVVEAPFSLRVRGAYPDVSQFLNKLVDLDRLIAFDNLNYSKDTQKSSEESTTISFNISGNLHYVANSAMLNNLLPSLQSRNKAAPQETSDVPEK